MSSCNSQRFPVAPSRKKESKIEEDVNSDDEYYSDERLTRARPTRSSHRRSVTPPMRQNPRQRSSTGIPVARSIEPSTTQSLALLVEAVNKLTLQVLEVNRNMKDQISFAKTSADPDEEEEEYSSEEEEVPAPLPLVRGRKKGSRSSRAT